MNDDNGVDEKQRSEGGADCLADDRFDGSRRSHANLSEIELQPPSLPESGKEEVDANQLVIQRQLEILFF